jgi:hypothetical protein
MIHDQCIRFPFDIPGYTGQLTRDIPEAAWRKAVLNPDFYPDRVFQFLHDSIPFQQPLVGGLIALAKLVKPLQTQPGGFSRLEDVLRQVKQSAQQFWLELKTHTLDVDEKTNGLEAGTLEMIGDMDLQDQVRLISFNPNIARVKPMAKRRGLKRLETGWHAEPGRFNGPYGAELYTSLAKMMKVDYVLPCLEDLTVPLLTMAKAKGLRVVTWVNGVTRLEEINAIRHLLSQVIRDPQDILHGHVQFIVDHPEAIRPILEDFVNQPAEELSKA